MLSELFPDLPLQFSGFPCALYLASCTLKTIMAPENCADEIQASPVSVSEASLTLDDAYETYKKSNGIETDPAELKRVLRKIDFRIVPILFFTYLLQYLDKNGINYASVYGLREATRLKKQDFSWLGWW
jgi:hypothetical protein